MSWETAGTVTVANNSATVTGAGTLFTAKSRVGDAFIGPDGRLYEITNIVSDFVFRISPKYLGDTADTQPYKIAPVRGYQKLSADRLYAVSSTIHEISDTILKLPQWLKDLDPTPVEAGGTGGTTPEEARANLGLKNSAVLDVGTEAGTVTAGDDSRLSDSREWIAETVEKLEAEEGTSLERRAFTAERVRQSTEAWWVSKSSDSGKVVVTGTPDEAIGALELGTTAKADLTTSTTDVTAGRVLKVGDFGVGSPVTLPAGTDLNTFTTNGSYDVNNAVNKPTGTTDWGYLRVVSQDSVDGYCYQEWTESGDANAKTYYRVQNLGTWGEWREFHHTGNILQATGSSTDLPMSQKAVTDALVLGAAGSIEAVPATIAKRDTNGTFEVGEATAPEHPVRLDYVTSQFTTKAPLSHTHPWSQVTGQPATATRWPTFTEVTDKPTNYATTWDSVAAKPAQATRWPTYAEVTGKPATFAPVTSSTSVLGGLKSRLSGTTLYLRSDGSNA